MVVLKSSIWAPVEQTYSMRGGNLVSKKARHLISILSGCIPKSAASHNDTVHVIRAHDSSFIMKTNCIQDGIEVRCCSGYQSP